MRRHLHTLAFLAALAAIAACDSNRAADGESRKTWVSSWVSAQQEPEPHNALPSADLEDGTLRQVIRLTLGGDRIRVRISNVHGTKPLRLGRIGIARSADPRTSTIDAGSASPVSFSGREAVTIPAGAYVVSDPIDFAVEPLAHLTVSIHYPSPPDRQTGHPGSRATSHTLHGDHVDRESLPNAKRIDHWYQLAGLDVETDSSSRALAIIGDSITDGFGVEPNSNERWTDFLIARVRGDAGLADELAVLNLGLGGNRLLLDGLGPNGLSRFDRDVIQQPGVEYAIVMLGVNDLGMLSREEETGQDDHIELVARMINAYAQMASRARENGIRAIGATIMPFAGSTFYPSDDMTEASRQAINAWIRTCGHFDAIIDFDARMRSADDPARLAVSVDSGDGLHPSIDGYRLMAEFVPLDLFQGATGNSYRSPCQGLSESLR